jgi:hypothetical protein
MLTSCITSRTSRRAARQHRETKPLARGSRLSGRDVMPTAVESSSVPAPLALRWGSSCVAGVAAFLGSFWVLFLAIGAATGFREIRGTLAVILMGVTLAGSITATVLAFRAVARLLRTRSWMTHVVVIILGLLLCWFARPASFSYAA